MSNGLNETKGFDGTDDSEAAGAAGEAEENELAVLWEALREAEQAAIDEMLVGDEEHPPLPGLHVDIASIQGIKEIDLNDLAKCSTVLAHLKVIGRDMCAKCVRLEIWNFAGVRWNIVELILDYLPLVHELALPDWKQDPQVLAFLCLKVGPRGFSNPRLRDVIFMDGTCEAHWW